MSKPEYKITYEGSTKKDRYPYYECKYYIWEVCATSKGMFSRTTLKIIKLEGVYETIDYAEKAIKELEEEYYKTKYEELQENLCKASHLTREEAVKIMTEEEKSSTDMFGAFKNFFIRLIKGDK